jgi:hypothetical protein
MLCRCTVISQMRPDFISEIGASVTTPLPEAGEDESVSLAVVDSGQSEVLESRKDTITTD